MAQYLISNAIAVMVLYSAWKKPTAARWCLCIIFLAASLVNAVTAVVTPEAYLDYERFAVLKSYRQFIAGWFADNTRLMVISIAGGQILIAMGMFLNGRFLKPAITGTVFFGLAIAPLGIGSAFPCSILLATAAVLLWNQGSMNQR